MTHFDFSPLFRTSVGFDRLANMLDNASRLDNASGYPPYNIDATDENHYRITMAVAGFSESDLSITSEQNILSVKGEKAEENNEEVKTLYRGIANRSFERRFQLADHVRVSGASLENGLLHIQLEREVPEAMKPRTIEIQSGGKGRLLESSKETDKAA